MNRTRTLLYIAGVALGLHMGTAAAAETLPAGAHLSGGVGGEDQQRMQEARAGYNLRLTLAETPGGAYLSDVSIKIVGANGTPSFGPFADSGPMFFAKLNPGVYQVSATHAGVNQTKTVKIGNAAVDEVFRWAK